MNPTETDPVSPSAPRPGQYHLPPVDLSPLCSVRVGHAQDVLRDILRIHESTAAALAALNDAGWPTAPFQEPVRLTVGEYNQVHRHDCSLGQVRLEMLDPGWVDVAAIAIPYLGSRPCTCMDRHQAATTFGPLMLKAATAVRAVADGPIRSPEALRAALTGATHLTVDLRWLQTNRPQVVAFATDLYARKLQLRDAVLAATTGPSTRQDPTRRRMAFRVPSFHSHVDLLWQAAPHVAAIGPSLTARDLSGRIVGVVDDVDGTPVSSGCDAVEVGDDVTVETLQVANTLADRNGWSWADAVVVAATVTAPPTTARAA